MTIFFRCLLRIVATIFVSASIMSSVGHAASPNVLVISIDDLNDWVGCLGGHPQARTPNIDRLARRGTLFANAHCQAPVCTPSRASLVTGLLPSSTGLYFLQPGLSGSNVTRERMTLVEHFAKLGYRTMGAGKFHHNDEAKFYQEYGGKLGGFGPIPKAKISYPTGLKLWDWGAYPATDAEMPDTKVADWVIGKLEEKQPKPFFLVAGFWRPHVPLYAPPRWFELFPRKTVRLPEVLAGDRDDLPLYAIDLTEGAPAPKHEWFIENNAWKHAVQSYLASIAFVDDCVGRVLDSLDANSHKDDTVIVLMSDHGWHLGEKGRWAKRSLWEESTHVPLIVSAPGFNQKQVTRKPAGLIDIYPTLLELTGHSPRADLQGRSLVPLLRDPKAEWDRPIVTTFGPKSHALRTEHHRYIRYADGSEELYDHRTDPHEWHNVAANQKHADLIAGLQKHLPKENVPVIDSHRPWEFEAWQNAEKNARGRAAIVR